MDELLDVFDPQVKAETKPNRLTTERFDTSLVGGDKKPAGKVSAQHGAAGVPAGPSDDGRYDGERERDDGEERAAEVAAEPADSHRLDVVGLVRVRRDDSALKRDEDGQRGKQHEDESCGAGRRDDTRRTVRREDKTDSGRSRDHCQSWLDDVRPANPFRRSR